VCVNIGGGEYTAADGRLFLAEDANPAWLRNGERSETITEIANTEDDTLYHTDRWGPMELFLPVPAPGVYVVELYLAEIFYGVNTDTAEEQRVFGVNIERFPAVRNFDINEVAGGPATAIIERFEATTFDNRIEIEMLQGAVDNPKLAALCVADQ